MSIYILLLGYEEIFSLEKSGESTFLIGDNDPFMYDLQCIFMSMAQAQVRVCQGYVKSE